MATATNNSRFLISVLSVVLSLGCGARSDYTCVIFVLDVSDSISFENRANSAERINQVVESLRGEHDRAGIIVFGRQPQFEIPIGAQNTRLERHVETEVDGSASNLDAAIHLAVNSFPECRQRRIVIISDGNETSPRAVPAAKAAIAAGVAIDVIPVTYDHGSDVSIDHLKTSSKTDVDGSVDIGVQLSAGLTEASDSKMIAGRLRIVRHRGRRQHLVAESDVQIPDGTIEMSFRDKPDRGGLHRYEAIFTADTPTLDAIPGNNRATSTVSLPVDDRVLFVENVENLGAFDEVANRLVSSGIVLERIDSAELPESLAEWQEYRCVILADVPHSPAIDGRIKMLTNSVRRSGSGLVVLGGLNSFGAGGWSGTELEKALPVRCVSNGVPSAIVLLTDIGSLPEGNFWQKEVAATIIKQMLPNSYVGILHEGGRDWVWGAPVGMVSVDRSREMMLARLGQLQVSSVRDLDAAMNKTLIAMNRVDVESKLMLFITGRATSSPSDATIRKFKEAGIQVTTVSLTRDRQETLASNLSQATGGRYYQVRNPKALPVICQREIPSVQLPPIYNTPSAVALEFDPLHPILDGIRNRFPSWPRFTVTDTKEDETVDIALISTEPFDRRYATILATWAFGQGRVVALTADLSQPVVGDWNNPDDYDRFLTQMVSWAMRPPRDPPTYDLQTEVFAREVRVIVKRLPGAQPLQEPSFDAIAIDPDSTSTRIELQADQDDRYSGVFSAEHSGTYSIVVRSTDQDAALVSEVHIRDLREHRSLATNLELLSTIAKLQPGGSLASWESNPFRREPDSVSLPAD